MIKIVKNDRYMIMFNLETGKEILTGINGNDDPDYLNYPSLLDVGVMNFCKNQCSFCYQNGDNINRKIPYMSLENFKKIVDQSKDHTLQIACGGYGDVNIHPYFKEILQYCRENNIVPNYTTSGNGLTDEQIEITKQFCGAVAISDYNQPFTYSTINKFINIGMKTNIHFVLSSERFYRAIDLLDGKDIWNNQFDISKLNAVIFLLFKPQGKGKGRYDLIPTDDQIKLFIEKIRNPKVKFKLGMDSCLVNKLSNLSELTKMESIFLDTCEASRGSTYITPDMKAVPCSFADHNKFGVQITDENPIQKIWNESEIFLNCRKTLLECKAQCPYIKSMDEK